MTYKEKNNDKIYYCKKVKTAIKRAIKDNIIDLQEDFGGDMEDIINLAEENGEYKDFWEIKEDNTFFRFNIEILDEGTIYIDLGYRLLN